MIDKIYYTFMKWLFSTIFSVLLVFGSALNVNADSYEKQEDLNAEREINTEATRLAEFTIRPVEDPFQQGSPVEVEVVDAVDVHGDPYTTGDDSFSNFDIEHPYDDDTRG